jgi:hypothetical protein
MNAPALDTEVSDAGRWKARVLMQSAFSYATLSNLLRILGAGVLVASVSIFLLKGWSTGNDIQRYLMLLAHTVLLGVTGLGIGYWVRESKGARLFLALSLVSAVVNFAVLGGLIYSQMQWDDGLSLYPGFARWQAGSPTAAYATAGTAFLLLVPVSWIAFLTLARRSAVPLTLLFMSSGSLLLIPVRQTEPVAALFMLSAAVLIFLVMRLKRHDSTLTTAEGRFARWIVFVPLIMLAGRGMYLYSADAVMYTVLCASAFLALRQYSMDSGLSQRSVDILNRLSVLPAIATATGVTTIAVDANWLADPLYIPLFAVTASALFLDISMRSVLGGSGYRRLASLTLSLAMLANLWLFPGLVTAGACLVSGLAISIYGYSAQQRIVFGAGLFTLVAGVVHQCRTVFIWFDWGNWVALALIGIAAIIAGSVLERHGAVLRARLGNWKQSMGDWQN